MPKVPVMPTTLHYRPELINKLISTERLNSYRLVFHPANDVELMGVYLWNAHVCSALYPLISAVEISLRNAIDHALTRDLGTFWWSSAQLRYRSYRAGAASPRAVQIVNDNFVAAARKYIADTRKRYQVKGHIRPTHAGVLAKTDFSTWECLLDAEFMGRNLVWPRHLSSVFSGRWPTHQAGSLLAQAKENVATLRDFRNRLFHHEPAWKRYGVQAEADALAHLHEKLSKAENLLRLIHPEILCWLEINGLLQNAYRACNAAEIRRFQHLARVYPIGSLNVLAESVARCHEHNCVVAAHLVGDPASGFLIVPR